MKKQYKSPEFIAVENLQSYCEDLNVSSEKLGDPMGGEDFID